MVAKAITTQMIKQLLLMLHQGKGIKPTACALGISKNTVKRYLSLIESHHLDISELLSMDSCILESYFDQLNNRSPDQSLAELFLLFPSYEQQLKEAGKTLLFIWEHSYKPTHPQGYSYSQFCFYHREYLRGQLASLHIVETPGERMYMDYAGKKLSYVDRSTGEVIPCEFYVALLGHSQFTYAEASRSQQKACFITSTVHALSYFDGVPKAMVPDNLKSAVTKASNYQAEINDTFLDMASYYGCEVDPARSLHPQDKAVVERAVNILYTRVYAELSKETFFSLEDLNKAIRACVDVHNDTRFQRKDTTRRRLYLEEEKMHLRPLPGEPYSLRAYKTLKVQKNNYIFFSPDGHYYSVPCQFIGLDVKVSYTDKEISVYYAGERVAVHLRTYTKGQYTTVPEHLPKEHQMVAGWSNEYFSKWGHQLHLSIGQYLDRLLDRHTYPQTAYKQCLGIVNYAERAHVSIERLATACQMGLEAGIYSYNYIDRVLRGKRDLYYLEAKKAEEEKTQEPVVEHQNIRGKDYYKELFNQSLKD